MFGRFKFASFLIVAAFTARELDAMGRVVYAEARSESITGRVAVLDTILNRLNSGKFGGSVIDVISARGQFEPVLRAGGWDRLPELSRSEQSEWSKILELKGYGILGDPTNGATHFQNAEIVRNRAERGEVKPSLVHFGGLPQRAQIGAHTFYGETGSISGAITPIADNPGDTGIGSAFSSRDISGDFYGRN